MNTHLFGSAFLVIVLLLLSQSQIALGQAPQGLEGTWKGPDLSLIRTIVDNAGAGKSPGGAKVIPRAANFTATGDSGVAKALSDVFGNTAQEKAALKDAFDSIKSGFDAEMGKQGKANNVAAALAFFMVTNVMVFHDSAAPPDAASEELFKKLQDSMASSAEFHKLTNADKQKMYDWFVSVAGFALANYQQAKSTGDAAQLKTIREFAGHATQIVLGAGLELTTTTTTTVTTTTLVAPQIDSKLLGVWSISASNHAGTNLVTNAGYSKGEYRFNENGTYSFKSERWFGYSRSREFYTTEEFGTYSVNSNSLTVTPITSKTIQRTPEGVVQKTQNNPLERVTYKWQLHYFEGINETNLVLQPPKETVRDGGFSSNSLFPNSYLYSQGSRLEWRF